MMTKDEYHAHPAQSYSKLKVLIDNPRQYYNRYILNLAEDTKTPSKNLGTCLDLALTDFDVYQSLQIKNTKTTSVDGFITAGWKSQVDVWMNDLYSYQMELPEFQRSDGSYLTLKQIFDKCTKQEMIFWDDPKTGEPMRAMLDFTFYQNGTCFWLDLKSTKAETFEKFMRDFEDYHYYLQVGTYSTALQIKYSLDYYPPAYYVAVSTTTGEIWVVKASDQMLTYGCIEMDTALGLLQHYRNTDSWCKNKPPIIAELSTWRTKKIIDNQQLLEGFKNVTI